MAENFFTSRLPEYEGDGPTLRQQAARCCKSIDIGTAVLPKPLCIKDWDERTQEDNGDDGENGTAQVPQADFRLPPIENERIAGATIEAGPEDHDHAHSSGTRYARILSSEFNSIVIEHHLKWAPLCHAEPGPLPDQSPADRLGRYDFHSADIMVDWALARKMKIKGHVLCWHVTTPPLVEDLSPEEVREQLRRHIFTTMGHFRGRIKMWDVVNESLAPDGTLAENVFLRKLGPGYIEDCFRWAHEADPDAFLIYNDNKVEGMGGPNAAKSDGFYNLLRDLVKRGVPIHGAGIQAHFNAAGTGRGRPPTPSMVRNQIRRIGDLGLKVNISELDVRVSKLPPNLQQLAQKQIYHDIIAAALTEPSFDGIWLWGFTDRHTWVSHFYYDDSPLIFDENYGRKNSYYGMRDALSTVAPGGTVGGGLGPYLESDYDEDGNRWGHLWMQPEPAEEDYAVSAGGGGGAGAGDSRPDWLQSDA